MQKSYQYKVRETINDRLIEFAMHECKSLYNIEILFNYYVEQVSQIYRNPKDHETKILTIAYNKTIKEYSQ